VRAALITSLAVAILAVPAVVRAEVAAECPAHLIRWIEQCQAATELTLEPVSCPRGLVRLTLRLAGGEPLDVEVNSEPQRAFQAAGQLGVSPILEVADFSEVPESQRRALETFIEWVEANQLSLTDSEIAPPPRAPEPVVPDRLELPPWLSLSLALLTLVLTAVYLVRGRRDKPTAEQQSKGEGSTPRALRLRVLWAGCVFLGAQIAGLLRAPAGVSLHVDTVRDLLIVKEWIEGPTAISLGSVSSTGLYHGFLWHRLLAAWQTIDPSLSSVNVAISTAMALSVLLLYLVVESWTSRPVGLVTAGAVIAATLGETSLFTPLWQPTLSPEFSCLIVGVLALDRGSGLRRRVGVVLTAAAIAVASQVHLAFLLLLPGLLIAHRKDLLIVLPALAGIVFVAWDQLSHDALGVNLAMLWSGSRVDAIAGGAPSIPSDWRAVASITVIIVASVLWLVGRARGWLPPPASWHVALSVMSGLYVVFGLALFGPRVLVPRYWTPALIIAIASLAVTTYHFAGQWRGTRLSWIGCAVFAASILAVAVRGRIHSEVMTLEDLGRVVDTLERGGLSAEDSFRSVNATPPLSTAFERGIWLRVSCQRSARRLGLREVDRRLLLVAERRGEQLPSIPELQLIEGRDRRLGLLPYEPYVETKRYLVCLRGEDRCYQGDRSFPNAGFDRLCFVGDWGSAIDAELARESRDVDIEFEVSIPARGPEHAVFLPSLDGQHGRVECRGEVVGVEGVQSERRDGGLLLLGSSESQRGSLRVRWPWRDPRCQTGVRQRPMPLVELESEPFEQLRPFLEAAP
jgi:hypothetical protein